MNRLRILRLAICLALAFLAVGLGGLSVSRKIEAFQPLGFEAAARAGAFAVTGAPGAASGLRPGDQIMLVNGGEVATRAQLAERLKERPESVITVLRAAGTATGGEQLVQVHYRRPAVEFDFAFLILA